MQGTNVNHIYNLKYSSIDPRKGKSKQVKLILIIFLTQYIKHYHLNIIQYQTFNDTFNIPFFGTKSLKSDVCFILTSHLY